MFLPRRLHSWGRGGSRRARHREVGYYLSNPFAMCGRAVSKPPRTSRAAIRDVQTILALFVFLRLRYFRSTRCRLGRRAHTAPCQLYIENTCPFDSFAARKSEPLRCKDRSESADNEKHFTDGTVSCHFQRETRCTRGIEEYRTLILARRRAGSERGNGADLFDTKCRYRRLINSARQNLRPARAAAQMPRHQLEILPISKEESVTWLRRNASAASSATTPQQTYTERVQSQPKFRTPLLDWLAGGNPAGTKARLHAPDCALM